MRIRHDQTMKMCALLSGVILLSACSQSKTDIDAEVTPTVIEVPDKPQQLALEDIDFSSYSSDLANYIGFERGESRISAIDKVRLNFASRESEIVQTSTSSFDRKDGSVMIFSVSGLKDDSVKSQQVFLILQGPKGDQKLAEYGMRIKCHRGKNTTDWQTDLCP